MKTKIIFMCIFFIKMGCIPSSKKIEYIRILHSGWEDQPVPQIILSCDTIEFSGRDWFTYKLIIPDSTLKSIGKLSLGLLDKEESFSIPHERHLIVTIYYSKNDSVSKFIGNSTSIDYLSKISITLKENIKDTISYKCVDYVKELMFLKLSPNVEQHK